MIFRAMLLGDLKKAQVNGEISMSLRSMDECVDIATTLAENMGLFSQPSEP